ncbi:hypothetical protein EI94DRAFT_1794769 [Lactarius quietus]|nr:hypothetical protein EI94DRAFT_1794769 [Lactarius quietus]
MLTNTDGGLDGGTNLTLVKSSTFPNLSYLHNAGIFSFIRDIVNDSREILLLSDTHGYTLTGFELATPSQLHLQLPEVWAPAQYLIELDSGLPLLGDCPAPIWILWLGTERLVNCTSTVLLMEEVTSPSIAVKFSLFCSKELFKPGAPKSCRLFEYSYAKPVHFK